MKTKSQLFGVFFRSIGLFSEKVAYDQTWVNSYKGLPAFITTGRATVLVFIVRGGCIEVESVNLNFLSIKILEKIVKMAAGEEMETESPEIEIVDVEKDAKA